MENKVGWVVLVCVLAICIILIVKPRVVGMTIEYFYPTTTTTTSTTSSIYVEPLKLENIDYHDISSITADGIFVVLRNQFYKKYDDGIHYSPSGIIIPVEFQTDVKNVYPTLNCFTKDEVLFDFLIERNKSIGYSFRTYSPSKYNITGQVNIWCQPAGYTSCIANGETKYDGWSMNSKILNAKKDTKARVSYNFDFVFTNDSVDMNCEAGIISSEPYQKVTVPFSIRYIHQ
jgi:hypothetical protein